jgi:hypothetical protein
MRRLGAILRCSTDQPDQSYKWFDGSHPTFGFLVTLGIEMLKALTRTVTLPIVRTTAPRPWLH